MAQTARCRLVLLVLTRTEIVALVAALRASACALAYAAIAQALTGERAFGPSASPVAMSVFVANLVVVLGSALSAGLTLMGARNATLHVPAGAAASPSPPSSIGRGSPRPIRE